MEFTVILEWVCNDHANAYFYKILHHQNDIHSKLVRCQQYGD